jgi:O-antigen/teichoic acid export membrane protein
MKIFQKLKILSLNEFFRASIILIVLMNIANILNYVFQFVMARMLGPADYSVMAVLTSILYIFNFPSTSIQTVMSRYATVYSLKKEFGKLRGIMDAFIKKSFFICLTIYVVYLAISLFLSKTLEINFWLLALTGLFVFGAFLYPIGSGILQGMKKFKAMGWNSVLNSAIKLIIAMILVFFGFKVYGAVLGFILGVFIAFIFIFPFIKEVINAKEIKENPKIFDSHSLYAFFAMLIVVLMYSIDAILAKAHFTADIAGRYAVLSMIGKIILFSTLTIGNAMFPISSERFLNGNKEKTSGIAKKTFIASSALCGIAILIFYLFPDFVVKILFGKEYLSLAGLLIYVALGFSFISLLGIFILYKLSINEFKFMHLFLLSIFMVIEFASMIIFNNTILDFTKAFMYSSLLALTGMVLAYKLKVSLK